MVKTENVRDAVKSSVAGSPGKMSRNAASAWVLPLAAALLSSLWSLLEQPRADVCSRSGAVLLALWVSAVFWLNVALPPVHLR